MASSPPNTESQVGGYDLQFVEMVPQSLICLICSFPACEPHQMKCCQTIYCRTCLEELRKKSSKCPNCHKLALSYFHLDSHKQILSKSVKCKNFPTGCTWMGTLRNYLDAHQPACPKEVKRCIFHDIGCRSKFPREDQTSHNTEKMGHHFLCALETIQKLKKSQNELRRSVNDMKLKLQPRGPVATFRMPHFDEHRSHNRCWYSSAFQSHPRGYKMCLRVDANGIAMSHGSHVSVFICLMQGEHDDDLVWPYRGTVTVELLNQLQDSNHHIGTVQFDCQQNDDCNSRVSCVVSGTGRGWPQFISHKALDHCSEKNCQYLKGDCLYFRVPKVEIYETNKPWLICNNTYPSL